MQGEKKCNIFCCNISGYKYYLLCVFYYYERPCFGELYDRPCFEEL